MVGVLVGGMVHAKKANNFLVFKDFENYKNEDFKIHRFDLQYYIIDDGLPCNFIQKFTDLWFTFCPIDFYKFIEIGWLKIK